MKPTLREIIISAIALLCITSAVYSWYHPKELSVPGPVQWRDVTKNVTNPAIVECKNDTLVVTNEEKPIEEQEGPKEPIIATGNVPASTGGFELETGLSPSTGVATIYAKPVPRSLFGFEDSKELGIRYNGLQGGLFARWTFFRVGSFYGALYGEGATDRHMFAGIEASYRW